MRVDESWGSNASESSDLGLGSTSGMITGTTLQGRSEGEEAKGACDAAITKIILASGNTGSAITISAGKILVNILHFPKGRNIRRKF